MMCPNDVNDVSSQTKTIILTVLTLLATMDLKPADKVDLARVIIYIGQVIAIDFTLEARELAQQAAQTQATQLQSQITSLTKQLDEMKKQLKC